MSTMHIVEIIVAIVGSTGAWQFIQYVITNKIQKKSATDQALIAVIHYLLYPKLEHVLKRGCVGYNEFDMICGLYAPYIELGGNGSVKNRFEEIVDLPKIPDSELEYHEDGKQ